MAKQRQKNDCVVAAIANAAGLPYKTVRKVCGTCRNGLEIHEIEWLLGEFADFKKSRARKSQTLDVFARQRNEGIFVVLVVSDLFTNELHAIAVVNGKIFSEDNFYIHTSEIYVWYKVTDLKPLDEK